MYAFLIVRYATTKRIDSTRFQWKVLLVFLKCEKLLRHVPLEKIETGKIRCLNAVDSSRKHLLQFFNLAIKHHGCKILQNLANRGKERLTAH